MEYKNFLEQSKTKFIKSGETPIVEQVNSNAKIEWSLGQSFSQNELFNRLKDISPMIRKVPNIIGMKRDLIGYGDKTIILIKNVVFMGNNHFSDQKRIEMPSYYKDVYQAARQNGIKVIIVGYYKYKDNEVFAVFNSEDYMSHAKVHQSAGWIYTTDIIEATVNGFFERVDRKGNHLSVMNAQTFAEYLAGEAKSKTLSTAEEENKIKQYFSEFFKNMPKDLYGIACYEEMRSAKYSQWRQSRWEGWYPEYLIQQELSNRLTDSIIWWGKKGAGEIDLDIKFPRIENFYGDAKSDNEDGVTQGNKKETIEKVINVGGKVWYIVFQWTMERDTKHGGVTTKWWNEALNDPKEKVNGRPKPLDTFLNQMKYSIHITRMEIYEIDSITFPSMKVYLPTKCNGKDRAPKVEIAKKDRDRFRIFVQEA